MLWGQLECIILLLTFIGLRCSLQWICLNLIARGGILRSIAERLSNQRDALAFRKIFISDLDLDCHFIIFAPAFDFRQLIILRFASHQNQIWQFSFMTWLKDFEVRSYFDDWKISFIYLKFYGADVNMEWKRVCFLILNKLEDQIE